MKKKTKEGRANATKRKPRLGASLPALLTKTEDLSLQESDAAKRPRKKLGRSFAELSKRPTRSPELQYFMDLEEEVALLRERASHCEKLEEEVATLRKEALRLQTWQDLGNDLESCPVCRNIRMSN